jgi:hypothetical protein
MSLGAVSFPCTNKKKKVDLRPSPTHFPSQKSSKVEVSSGTNVDTIPYTSAHSSVPLSLPLGRVGHRQIVTCVLAVTAVPWH